MEIKIIQNTTKVMDEARNEVSSITSEYYMISPAKGKKLKNIKTGEISAGPVYIPTLKTKNLYEEVELEANSK
jgi:hypothetical protein